jgi:transcriptional regulator with XRE-family HTH domain
MSRARVSVAAQAPSRCRVAAAFGQVLRARRKGAGLSQETFAELAGMDRATPSTYERGLRQPTLSHLFLIALALQIDAEQLVADTRLLLQEADP